MTLEFSFHGIFSPPRAALMFRARPLKGGSAPSGDPRLRRGGDKSDKKGELYGEDLFYLGHLLLYRPLNTHPKGYLRARTPRTCALQPDPDDAFGLVYIEELDTSAVRLQGWPYSVHSLLNPIP